MSRSRLSVGATLGAIGVVYGDIGTSPLYALKEVFGGAHHPVPITPDNVLGILSLIFWSLTAGRQAELLEAMLGRVRIEEGSGEVSGGGEETDTALAAAAAAGGEGGEVEEEAEV